MECECPKAGYKEPTNFAVEIPDEINEMLTAGIDTKETAGTVRCPMCSGTHHLSEVATGEIGARDGEDYANQGEWVSPAGENLPIRPKRHHHMTHDEWIAQTTVPKLVRNDLWKTDEKSAEEAKRSGRPFDMRSRHYTDDEVREELKHVFVLAERALNEVGMDGLGSLFPLWYVRGLRETVSSGHWRRGGKPLASYHDEIVRRGAFFATWAVDQWEQYFHNEAYAALEDHQEKSEEPDE
jgi:hypothetical protein